MQRTRTLTLLVVLAVALTAAGKILAHAEHRGGI